MCQTIMLMKSNQFCETVKELKSVLPKLELVKNEMYAEIDEDSCLCQLDLEDTFDNANIKWESDCMRFTLKDL